MSNVIKVKQQSKDMFQVMWLRMYGTTIQTYNDCEMSCTFSKMQGSEGRYKNSLGDKRKESHQN